MDKNKFEVYEEILNRIYRDLELHPYLSGLITKEHQNYLHTLAIAIGCGNWKPSKPHDNWDIEGNSLYKYDDEEEN